MRMKKEAELAAERLAWQHHQGATSLSPGAGISSATSERLSRNLQSLFSERAHSAPSTQPAGKGAHTAFDSDDDELSDPPDDEMSDPHDDELSDLPDISDLSSPGASSTDSQEPRGSPVAIEMATATRSYRVCIGKNTSVWATQSCPNNYTTSRI